jgi:hypothetical protein
MSTPKDRIIVRHDFPSDWSTFLREVVRLVGSALIKDERRRPHAEGTLVPLAFVALLVYLGFGHVLARYPKIRELAAARVCPPGRKPAEPSAQIELLDVLTLPIDPIPGVYISLARLNVGHVVLACGQYELSLQGCHLPSTAIPKAYAAGWGVLPERRGAADGLRFLPPTVCTAWLRGELGSFTPDNSSMADVGQPSTTKGLTQDEIDCMSAALQKNAIVVHGMAPSFLDSMPEPDEHEGTAESEAPTEEPTSKPDTAPVKRGRGRPKGSKSKPAESKIRKGGKRAAT